MGLVNGELVVVRGAGDLATGTILRLVRAGFRVAALEQPRPSSIRRTVCLSEAMYEGEAEVEGVRSIRVGTLAELKDFWSAGDRKALCLVLADPGCSASGGPQAVGPS